MHEFSSIPFSKRRGGTGRPDNLRQIDVDNTVDCSEEPSCDQLNHPSQPITVPIDRMDFRIARNRNDFTGAFELLQKKYVEAGLASHSKSKLRVLPYHLWNQTQLFVAESRGNVIASVSVVQDGHPEGLPIESVYDDVVNDLRKSGHGFGEVCSLTVDSPGDRSTGKIFGHLTQIMTHYSRHIGLDYLVAVVHPRHAKFYQRAMGFEMVGVPKVLRHVGGKPGIPIICNINDRSRFHPRWRHFYFDSNFRNSELDPHLMKPSDVEFFRQFVLSDGTLNDRRAA